MPETANKITEDQAAAAIRALAAQASAAGSDDAPEPEPAPAEPAPAAPAVEEPTPEVPEAAQPQEAASDDVDSLRKRLADAEAAREQLRKEADERTQAIQARFSQNESILRERYLKKSTVTDRALRILRASRTQEGVPETEVDGLIREIESTMNPNSANYNPATIPQPALAEDQAIVLNNFLNEKAMSKSEADSFAKWIRSEASTALSPIEQAVAARDLDGFLRLAHVRYQEGERVKSQQQRRDEAVGAVRSVQITQRQAARAASSVPTAPKKTPAGPAKEIDVRKLTKDDVSTLLRQSVEMYK